MKELTFSPGGEFRKHCKQYPFDIGQDSKARFGQDFKFTFSRDADVWLRF